MSKRGNGSGDYWSKLEVGYREAIKDWISQRQSDLARLQEGAELRVLNYLIATNSGGAIALLAFMGNSEYARRLFGLKVSLSLFVIGIVICGGLVAYFGHH